MSTYEEITVRLPDGYPASARLWSPEGRATGGVLYLHGIQSHAGWYDASAQALCDAGMAVLQPDRRGSGRNASERGHADSPQQLIDDALACLEVIAEHAGQPRVHVLGVSWGGKLAAAMHVHQPARTRSLTLVTPGLFPVVDVSAAEKFRIGWSMVSNPERLFDIPLNDPRLFTADPQWIRFLENDSLQLHQATAGFFLASRRMDRTARRLPDAPAVPLHLLLAADERIVDNEATRAFIREMSWPHRVVTCFDNSRHTLEMGPDRDSYLEDLVRWLSDPEAFTQA
ncbi:MAG: alpha/beta hydrolase [bacterium]|nr:alpha/beta hydrolase [bacterium]